MRRTSVLGRTGEAATGCAVYHASVSLSVASGEPLRHRRVRSSVRTSGPSEVMTQAWLTGQGSALHFPVLGGHYIG